MVIASTSCDPSSLIDMRIENLLFGLSSSEGQTTKGKIEDSTVRRLHGVHD